MPTYKTPDVYVEEISVFPPSVAEVETAIPAFIGYTEIARKIADDDLIRKPTKIYSLKEYERYYGYPEDDAIAIKVANNTVGGFTVSSFSEPAVKYLMYYCVKMFFDNGGGQCYIISVGTYQATPAIDLAGDSTNNLATMYGLQDGLDALKLEDEPTLIIIPEAVKLNTTAEYSTLVQAVLLQCNTLRDRFAIFDIFDGGEITALDSAQQSANREYFGNNYLKYGAAYYPFIKTTMNFYVKTDETNVNVVYPMGNAVRVGTTAPLLPGYTPSGTPTVLTASADGAFPIIDGVTLAVGNRILVKDETGTNQKYNGIYTVTAIGDGTSAWKLTRANDVDSSAEVTSGLAASITEGTSNSGKSFKLTTPNPITLDTTALAFTQVSPGALSIFETSNTAVYNFVKGVLKEHFVVLPPSGAVAGVYAATDSNRGVWKAPANVSLAEPVIKLDNTKQDGLNVDATTGKSINAIRAFSGKGTLVWGARTLAGNDNEWRYISVRRFFNMVEESVKKSTYWAVFEPNDANTWVKVRGMIENYLTQKWREGALAGATTKDAFFVKCGLGTTMTSQDILEGRMNVEIGMAIVRPAEFIILKFSHKLQTS